MNYVNTPNIPEKLVKLAVTDGRISEKIERSLTMLGMKLIKTLPVQSVHPSVAFHPDIMLHHIQDDLILCAPDMDERLEKLLRLEGLKIIRGKTRLSLKYPADVAYNVARVGQFAFHNLKYTDGILRNELEKAGVEFIHVNQGYSKCSISVVDRSSIITADKGIANAAEKAGIEALLIQPDQGILLPGLDYGFIGGSTGLISCNQWAVAGDIEKMKSSVEIYDFLHKKGISIISLSDENVTDIGTIIPLLSI